MSTILQNVGFKLINGLATLTYPDGLLRPAMWSSTPADVFPASKAQSVVRGWTNFDLPIGTTPPVAREEVVFHASTAGTINKFAAAMDDTGTSTDCDFVLKKNGVSIMTGDLTITQATSDRAVVEGTLSDTSFVAGDQFSIQLIVNSGTDAHGPYAWAEFIESGLS